LDLHSFPTRRSSDLFLPRRLIAKFLTRELIKVILSGMSKISFVKYSGNGNDFVILKEDIPLSKEVVQKLCHRHFGIGADGIMIRSEEHTSELQSREN